MLLPQQTSLLLPKKHLYCCNKSHLSCSNKRHLSCCRSGHVSCLENSQQAEIQGKVHKIVRFGSGIEFRMNGDHQNDRNFDPDSMEGLPDPKYKVSGKFLKVFVSICKYLCGRACLSRALPFVNLRILHIHINYQ